MSTTIAIARHLMAVMQPQTGERATGVATVTASGADVTIPRSTYALPIVSNQIRPDLAMKVGEGPNDDGSWTATALGVDVDFLSNIGGERHNIADGTELIFDPPISGIASVVANADFSGGTNPDYLGGIVDMVQFEQLGTANPEIDMFRSSLKGFPAVIVAWQGSKQVEDPMPRAKAKFEETYTISVISSKANADYFRRQEGQIVLDAIRSLLIDRNAVDGVPFCNPKGLRVVRRGRQTGNNTIYQAFYIYYLEVAVTGAFAQDYSRSYEYLDLINIDILKPQDPALPNQGDFTMVDDMQIDTSE